MSIYNLASCSAGLVAFTGIKCTDFVNRSTTTKIELFFLCDFGCPDIMSQVTHFCFQLGIESGFIKSLDN